MQIDLQAQDNSQALRELVLQAGQHATPLRITGGGSKAFYGRNVDGTALDTTSHCGVIEYDPAELVITARAGTPLRVLEKTLAEAGQMLAFEPPWFGDKATLGGAIACGLSGPRRPYTGAARDFVLGARVLTGHGEILNFGGRVMKNVAGYDIARAMCGALGTLGVILDVSLKVLPKPPLEITLTQKLNAETALRLSNEWASRPLPLSGTCYDGERLHVRLSGTEAGIAAARQRVGGDETPSGEQFWSDLREQKLRFFQAAQPIWRIAVPPATAPLNLPGVWFYEWGGAQRWLASNNAPEEIRAAVAPTGGHATQFRRGDRRGYVFHPLSPALTGVHRRLKTAFDPAGILNRGRMYPEW